jgi:hypothetical protein
MIKYYMMMCVNDLRKIIMTTMKDQNSEKSEMKSFDENDEMI